jgi:hypothetical protein
VALKSAAIQVFLNRKYSGEQCPGLTGAVGTHANTRRMNSHNAGFLTGATLSLIELGQFDLSANILLSPWATLDLHTPTRFSSLSAFREGLCLFACRIFPKCRLHIVEQVEPVLV